MSYWRELRRRNVFKVAAAYAVLAWLLIQVAGVVFPQLNLPGYAPTLVTVLLIFGFPLAVFLAWAYELTPHGIKRTRHVPLARSMTHVTGQKLNYVVTGLLVLAVAYIAVDTYFPRTRSLSEARSARSEPLPAEVEAPVQSAAVARRDLPKVAILPCENLSPDPRDASLAEGINLEIHSRVASLSGLLVIARTSMLRYANDSRPPSQIADEVGAQAVMECTVRYAGNNVLVTANLTDPETDTLVMSVSHPGDASDVNTLFAMQADIAMQIANALNAEFSPAEQATIERVLTDSPAAYARYLRARDLIAGSEFGEAIRELELAVELDAGFAEAYAHLARLFAYGQITSAARGDLLEAGRGGEDFAALTLENAARALELYPRLGLAWVARALTHQFHYRWDEAREAYARAVALSPNDVDVLGEYARFQREAGDVATALAFIEQAVDLDPNGALTLSYSADIATAAGRTEVARARRDKALSLVPTDPGANMLVIASSGGDAAAAERHLRAAEDLLDYSNGFFLVGIASGYRALGLEADAERALDGYEDWASAVGVGAAEWAQYHMVRGDLDRAYERLEEAVVGLENGATELGYIALNSRLTDQNPALAADRFQRLFARLDALKAGDSPTPL